MALADLFDKADVLASLSWVGMTHEARFARMASLYIKSEYSIRASARNYRGPTEGIVRLFVKNLYTPPRGYITHLVDDILVEIDKQKKTIKEREVQTPWEFTRPNTKSRLAAIAKGRYSIWSRARWEKGKRVREDRNCIGIARLGECRLIFDGGTYSIKPRIHIRQLGTNKVKVVVLNSGQQSSVIGMLSVLTTKAALLGAFSGQSVRFDFDAEAFDCGGRIVPWQFRKIYRGAKAARHTSKDGEDL